MKTNYVFLLLLFFLGGFLFLSNQYDYKQNGRKIALHNCLQTEFRPFPADFVAINHAGRTLKTPEAYDNGKLNYQNLGLTKLPDNLFKDYSYCIEHLYLKYNHFSEIPQTVRYLKNLQKLDLSASGLTSLTSANSFDNQLLELKELDLKNNGLKLLDYLPITRKPLMEVSLKRNKIRQVKLPRDANEYSVLEIDLSLNSFKEFPIELLRIKNISTLNLDHNQIYTVPELTKSDYQIAMISLKDNHLSQFPNQLSKVKKLKFLYLNNNKISGTVYISGFPDLENLEIIIQSIDTVILNKNAIPKTAISNLS